MTALDDLKVIRESVKKLEEKVEKLETKLESVKTDVATFRLNEAISKTEFKYIKWSTGVIIVMLGAIALKLGIPIHLNVP